MAVCGISASNPTSFPPSNAFLRASRHPPFLSFASLTSSNSGEQENGGAERVSSFPLTTHGNVVETRQPNQGKGMVAGSGDLMKLFNDTQQNLLHLNKQRLTAVEGLRRAERENELLLARIGLLEAEKGASVADCEALRRQLKVFETKFGRGIGKQFEAGRRIDKSNMDSSSIFSMLLLRIDSMVLTGAISEGQGSSLRGLVLNKNTQAAEIFSSVQGQDDKELASRLLPLLNPNQRSGLHITHICTELDPVAKSGVVGAHVMGLSRSLTRRGNVVEVILPKYAIIDLDRVENLREIPADFYSLYGNRWHKNRAWTGVVYGIAVTFIETFHPGGFFTRNHLYDYSDDFDRFTYFCRAALEYIVKSGKQPNILHLHNWQSAAVAPLFWDVFASQQGLGGTRILLTIYNFENQGLHEPAKLALCGLDPYRLHRADRLQDNLDPRLANILKGGIVYSNKVTTVSPVQDFDVMTRDHSHGLESTLIAHRNKFVGVHSGLDEFLWDPRSDPFLPSVYSFENLEGKLHCKSHLRQHLGLLDSDVSIPLVGCLVPHLSELELELIKAAMDSAMVKSSQFVFMGASKTPRVQMMVEDLQRELEEKGGRGILKHDDSMAHLLIASSDILVCVPINELPAQLPLIAMQYGTIPVVKQDGFRGRFMDADDVSHWSEATAFIFQSATRQDLMLALSRAIDCLMKDPKRWEELMRNGMSKDPSWDAACVDEYLAAYRSIRQL